MTLTSGQLLQFRYRVIALLAQGGFGAVYQGWDDNLGEPVAIKENLDASSAAGRQFRHEAQILSSLSHANLPHVTDYFFIPGMGQYLVMNYIEGEDLQAMLNRLQQPLPEAQVLAWIDQVCDALEYLHAQNPPVIHRDIKPANIKITPQDRAVLVDFGISKIYDPQLKTTLGARAVTPPYSPPEQYGQGITDQRSDVYALGATLYALLTGQEPAESIDRVLNGTPLTPPRQLMPALSPQVEAAILRACEVNKTQRFQTAHDLRQALRSQPPAGSPAAMTGPSGRLRIAIAGIIVVIVALIILNIALALRGCLPPLSTPTPDTPRPMPIVTQPAPTVAPTQAPAADTPTPAPTLTPSPTASPTPGIGSAQVSPKDGMTLRFVPAGEYTRGSDNAGDEKPPHKVYVDAFWIDQTEVTNAMFKKFVENAGYETDAEKTGIGKVFTTTTNSWLATNGANWQHPRGPDSDLNGRDDYPVVQVTWNDAKAYCEWAGRRLLTEAEWEKAARGTDGRTYPWGFQDVAGNLLNFADSSLEVPWANKNVDDGYQYTAPVGHYPDGASPYRALDMAGNVWEWVADWYGEIYYASSPNHNPPGPETGNVRVFRGGGWNDAAANVRAADRYGLSPDGLGDNGGFRCAR